MSLKKYNTNLSGYRAFTLAEALITLVLIGIVAAAVIPTVVDHIQKDMNAMALRKAYSTMNQVLPLMAREFDVNGDLNDTGLFDGSDAFFGDNLIRYIKVSKNCRMGDGCFPSQMGTQFKNSSSQINSDSVTGSHYSFIANDNMSYVVESSGAGCVPAFDGASSSSFNNQLKQICGKLWVDVNGFKPPNNFGSDIFLFYIANGVKPSLYPAGGRDDAKMRWSYDGVNAVNCTDSSPDGYACAGRIMEQSWQIKY